MASETATAFNLQKFCINDGPGIRTTLFLKGCPLDCVWCHNPESKSFAPQLGYMSEKCVGCGACVAACPQRCHAVDNGIHTIDREKCTTCGACVAACPQRALEIIGYTVTVEEVLEEFLKDKSFYDTSGGGVTISGGEPLVRFRFVLELLKACKAAGLHTAVETCGHVDPEHLLEAAYYVDLFLYDYKETDPNLHRRFTAFDNRRILENLALLDRLGRPVILRCPIIPGYNDRTEHLNGIAVTAGKFDCIQAVEIEPFHPLGSGKSTRIGEEYALAGQTFPPEADVQSWIAYIAARTAKPVRKA